MHTNKKSCRSKIPGGEACWRGAASAWASTELADIMTRQTTSIFNRNKFKLGLFATNCSGGLSLNKAPERWDASWDSNLAAARNSGIGVARGKYIAYLDDDRFYPEHLETLVASLEQGSHRDVTGYHIVKEGEARRFVADTAAGRVALRDPGQLAGYGGTEARGELVLRHHGLHVILVIDPKNPIGGATGLADIILESALTTIQDCEDSVAAVDAEDKSYRRALASGTSPSVDAAKGAVAAACEQAVAAMLLGLSGALP